jgi:hypothetical protein
MLMYLKDEGLDGSALVYFMLCFFVFFFTITTMFFFFHFYIRYVKFSFILVY